jgi:hypothetical protein
MHNFDELPSRLNNIPLIVVAIPLCLAQLMGARHMRARMQRLIRDPHIWLPWKNRTPWKNPIQNWWHNSNPFVVTNPWQNSNPWHPATGQSQSFWKNSFPKKAPSQSVSTESNGYKT